MHWLDSTLLALLGLGAGFGFFSGLLWQVARVASLGLSLYVCVLVHDQAAELVRDHLLRDADPVVIQGAAYVVVFLIVYCLLLSVTKLAQKLLKASGFAWMDRLLGAGLGAGKTAAILGAGCMLLARFEDQRIKDCLSQSTIAPTLSQAVEAGLTLIPEETKRQLSDSLMSLRPTTKTE